MSKKKKKKPNLFYTIWRIMFYGMLVLGLLFIVGKIVGWFVPLPIPDVLTSTQQQDAVVTETANFYDCADITDAAMAADLEQQGVRTNCEFFSSEDTATATISGFDFTGLEVTYSMVNDIPLFEGDIILGLGPRTPSQMGTGIVGERYRWPNGLVPYEIDSRLPNQFRIHDAIEHWEANTSIRFVERTESNRRQYPNYIIFQPGFGCSSFVGMVGGGQPINLALGCTTGATIHEIGHAVGLWHEHSRIDRDEHVTIVYDNIMPAYVYNFNKHIIDGMDLGDYDYESIMHYPRWAFSKNGEDTIVPKGNHEIGQRTTLSATDIASVEELYKGVVVGR